MRTEIEHPPRTHRVVLTLTPEEAASVLKDLDHSREPSQATKTLINVLVHVKTDARAPG